MTERTEIATVETDRRGRIQLPTAMRKSLGIFDERQHLVKISVSVIKPTKEGDVID